MISLRILVLEDHLPQRKAITQTLIDLGVCAVFHAGATDKAMAIISATEGVDVVVCNLGNQQLGHFDFLLAAAKARLISALVLGAALEPQLMRAVESISQCSRLKLIGVLGADNPLQDLGSILRDYTRRKMFPLPLALDTFKLPVEEEVRRAMDAGEFKAWFQPKFDLRTGQLCGVEALARWEHPSRGLLLPSEFLSAVLAYDLIDEMFKHVFAQGLELLAHLRKRNVSLQIAFNLHASQLASLDLVSVIEEALIEHRLCGTTLMFEVTENGLLDMPVNTLKNLLCLQLLGCGLSIDDFGIGFSSLALLCQLPFNQLKLDSSVVQDLTDHRSQTVVASTLALANALQMSVVIEGVSSQEIRERARALGGTFAQGFHLAKPMSARRLKEWLE